MCSVLVLLSTYNGEQYIREQIESILQQKEVEVYILIRDDGSVDETLNIVLEYSSKKVSLIRGENIGYRKSFFHLMTVAERCFDYYAFADQDDYWLDDKLISGIRIISQFRKAAYCSKSIYVDRSLNNVDYCYSSIDDIPEGIVKPEWMVCNGLAAIGCTFIWDREMHNTLVKAGLYFNNPKIAHDNYMSVASSFVGTLYKEHRARILYRQHESNISGSKTKVKIPLFKMMANIKNLNDVDYELRNFILQNYRQSISNEKLALLEDSINYKHNLCAFLRLLLHNCAEGLSFREKCKFFYKLFSRNL